MGICVVVVVVILDMVIREGFFKILVFKRYLDIVRE